MAGDDALLGKTEAAQIARLLRQGLGVEAQAGRAQQAGDLVETEFMPQAVEREDIAEGQRRVEADAGAPRRVLWRVARGVDRCAPSGAKQAAQQ